jgi:hypothetical protein
MMTVGSSAITASSSSKNLQLTSIGMVIQSKEIKL